MFLESNDDAVAIYIGNAALPNLEVALESSVWGFKDGKLAAEVHAGQFLLLVSGFKNSSRDVNAFPRCPVEAVAGTASRVVVAEILTDPFESSSQVWADELYPIRFKFKVVDDYKRVHIAYQGHSSLGWAMHQSANVRGAAKRFLPAEFSFPTKVSSLTTDQLRIKALESVRDDEDQSSRSVSTRYFRSDAVRRYVLARANGTCELCKKEAPFISASASAYLEAHHVHLVSEGGADHPCFVAALCPNCHREVHFGIDGPKKNELLIKYLAEVEPAGT